ncbi:MAG: outer membrane protein assembly factor BamD [Paludibacteraceae bacterium]|nr:outer membrane protein assembly factor BamD [Paludibacteraceae bacterium]
MKKRLFIFVLLLLGTFTCQASSEYSKILKSTDNDLKYEAAVRYFDSEKYSKAVTLFEQIAKAFRGTDKAEKILYMLATSHTKLKDYESGAHYYNTYTLTYLTGDHFAECLYMLGYCYYQMSPESELDQTPTNKAIDAFQYYLSMYPKEEHAEKVKKYLNDMYEKLAVRELASAKLYYNLGDYKGNNYRSAIITAMNAMNDYPDSRFLEDFAMIVVRSKYKEAIKSVDSKIQARSSDATDECHYFLQEYPESKYVKEVNKIINHLGKYYKPE